MRGGGPIALTVLRSRLVCSGAFLAVCATGLSCTPFKDDGPSPCEHRKPPSPPGVHGSGGNLDLVFALTCVDYSFKFNGDDGRPSIGFDLDGTCTGEGEGLSCVEPPWASADHTDGVAGIDNASAQVWATVASDGGPCTLAPIEMIIRVRGYSGAADDDQVEVSPYLAFGLVARGDGGLDPVWDGKDQWRPLPDSLVPLGDPTAPTFNKDQPRFTDKAAYVSNWTLVAHFPDALGGTATVVPVKRVVIAGGLVPHGDAGSGWQLQGVVVGSRVAVPAAIPLWARLPLAGSSSPLCSDKTSYELLKGQFCSYVDIAADTDSPTAPCNAFSAGFRGDAKQALLGEVADASPVSTVACDPAVHPDTDTCGPVPGP
jgi:hypothetical protein